MYYSLSHINSRNSTIGYATSPTLEYGSWTDYGSIGISTQEVAPASTYNAIDPALILVNGQYYLTFGSFWNDLQIIALNANATAPATAYPAGVTQIQYQPAGAHPAEASFIYQYTPPGTGTSYFYLFWSEGIANGYDSNIPAPGAEYQVRVCRSTTVTSGYVDASGRSCLSGYGETVLASHDQVCECRCPASEFHELERLLIAVYLFPEADTSGRRARSAGRNRRCLWSDHVLCLR